MSFRAWVMLMALGGCQPNDVSASAASASAALSPSDPTAEAAHAALFAAADDLDLVAFKGHLTAESVTLIDAAILAGAKLGRPPKSPPLSWEDVMEAHRAVSPTGRSRTPYRRVSAKGATPERLDLTASPIGDLARTLIESAERAP